MGNKCDRCRKYEKCIALYNKHYCFDCYTRPRYRDTDVIVYEICFECNKKVCEPYCCNGLKYCNSFNYNMLKFIDYSIIEKKCIRIDICSFYDTIYCQICEHKIKDYGYLSTFHHCFIPIKNKYMNVNIL